MELEQEMVQQLVIMKLTVGNSEQTLSPETQIGLELAYCMCLREKHTVHVDFLHFAPQEGSVVIFLFFF